MIPWIILKTLPALADMIGMGPERIEVYAYLAGLTAISAAFGLLRRQPIHQHLSLAWPVAFFVITLALQASTLAKMETLAMVPTNLRCNFLAVTFLPIFLLTRKVRTGMVLLVAQQVLIQFLSLSELTGGGDAGSLEALGEGEQVRFGGIYGSPWQYSYSSIVLLSCVLLTFRHSRSYLLRIGLVGIVLMTFYGMTLCVNRANIPCVLLLFAGWWADRFAGQRGVIDHQRLVRSLRTIFLAGIVVLVGFLAVFFLLGDVRNNLLDYWAYRFETGEASDGIRFDSWKVGFRLFLNNPLVGVGWDRVAIVGPAYGLIMTVHNSFIQAAAEGGIFGFAYGVTLLLVVPIYLLRQAWHFEGRYIFLASYACILLFNCLASNLHYENHWDLFMFWVLLLEWRAGVSDTEHARSRLRARDAGPALGSPTGNRLPMPARSTLPAQGPA